MPNFTFTSPDGKQYTVTGPDGATADQAFQILQKQIGSPPAPKANPDAGSRLLGGLEGDVDAFGKAVSSIPAGVAGAAGFVKGLLTPGQNAGDTAENWQAATKDFMNKPRFTIGTPEAQQGQRTQEGNAGAQQGISAVMNIPSWLAEKGSDLAITGLTQGQPQAYKQQLAPFNARLQAASNLGANIVPMFMGSKYLDKETPVADQVANLAQNTSPDNTPLAQANALGYKVAPSDAVLKGGKATFGKVAEGFSGSPKLQVDASVRNQPITNALAAKDIGVPAGTDLTPDVLDQAAQPHYAAYKAVKQLGTIPIDDTFRRTVDSIGRESEDAFPMDTSPALDKLRQAYTQPDSFGANGAVLKIRQLRNDGNLNIASRDPERMQLGYAQRQVATAIEDQIDRYASSRPQGFDNPNLIQNFRNARQNIAKIETVRDAITPGTTDVSASYLAKQLNKGKPLSGNLAKIADTYNNFPNAMRNAGPLRNKTQVNALEGMMGGAGLLYGAAAHNPGLMMKTAALITGRPLLRAGLLTDAYQASMIPHPINPLLRTAIPGIGVGALMNGNRNPLLTQQP